MNYIILNNKNSTEIKGLLISTLPPISKPSKRYNQEEIDGRDGDLITELGYKAYDKEFQIGLTYNYDVDEVISYFDSKGTVTFSNEPDKYYNYEIIEQIDFEKLIRFKTATIKMHVQPFKYSATDESVSLHLMGSASGDNIYLTDVEEAKLLKVELKGKTEQETRDGYNLCNAPYTVDNKYTFTASKDDDNRILGYYATLEAGVEYKVSFESDGAFGTVPSVDTVQMFLLKDKQHNNYIVIEGKDYIFTPTVSGDYYIRVDINKNGVTHSFWNFFVRKSTETREFELYGKAPTPDLPSEIKTVTGDVEVSIDNGNMFDFQKWVDNGFSINTGTKEIIDNGIKITATSGDTFTITYGMDTTGGSNADKINKYGFKVNPSSTYRITADVVNNVSRSIYAFFYDKDKAYIKHTSNASHSKGLASLKFTTPENAEYVCFRFGISTNGATEIFSNIRFNKGETDLGYVEHKGGNYPLSLGSLELCKIGDYADYIYKADSKWFKRSNVGKANTNVNNVYAGTYTKLKYAIVSKPSDFIGYGNYSNYEVYYEKALYSKAVTEWDNLNNLYKIFSGAESLLFFIGMPINTTLEEAKTLLDNTKLYYPLATPTDTEITDTTLIEQLNAIENATLYNGVTNIIITSDNLTPTLEFEYCKDNTVKVINKGNRFSKPIFTIYGVGLIKMYLNGNQMFSVELGDEEYITIDIEKMEAYKDTISVLKNRLVTGNYDNFILNSGTNIIDFEGNVTGFEILKYSRWI